MLFPFPSSPATPARVVVTGVGIVTALGLGWKPNAQGFRAGRTAFRPVSLFDVSRHRAKRAAEVDLADGWPSHTAPAPGAPTSVGLAQSRTAESFAKIGSPKPTKIGAPGAGPTGLSCRQSARLDRAGTMLLLAAREAWQQAQWQPAEDIPLVLGTTAGGMELGEVYFRQATQRPRQHRRQPTRALHYQPHVQARMVLDALGFNGPITIISNACASGGNAVGQAWELLRGGQAERVLTGGYDALTEMVFSGFDSLQALSPTVCRPFDARRDGLALGEGAAILALETLESARRRGAIILGELIGYGTAIDQHHLTQPHPQGETALAVMELACASAGITAEAVGYVNAHGTGTPLNDSAEAQAISRWANRRAATLPVSSTKASIGHLLGAAGAVEAVVCLMALREQWLPPQTAFDTPDSACAFPIVRQPQDARLNVALSNSFGFGGVNATLVMRRWM